MKRLLILNLLVSFLSLTSSAQITQGNWMVGGTGRGRYYKNNGTTLSFTDLAPNIGYFFVDKLAAGVRMEYNGARMKQHMPDGTTPITIEHRYGVGLFSRYYFLSTENRINLLTDAGVKYFLYTNNSMTGSSKEMQYSVMAGPVLFFNSAVGLELLVGYSSSTLLSGENHKTNSLQFDIGLQVHLEKEK